MFLLSVSHIVLGWAEICSREAHLCVLFPKVQQVASFLPDTLMSPHLMQGYGSQVILLTSGLELMLFTIHGLQLVAFQDHQKPITSMRVVSAHPPCPWHTPPPGGHIHTSLDFISRTSTESSPPPWTSPCVSTCGIRKINSQFSRAAITCLEDPTNGPGKWLFSFTLPVKWS